jgi:hypothetical protein
MTEYHSLTLTQTIVSGLFAGAMGLLFAILLTDANLFYRISRVLVLALPPFIVTLIGNCFQVRITDERDERLMGFQGHVHSLSSL